MDAEYLPGNRVTLLNSGDEFFPALLAAIDGAEREVHLETYIFEADETGQAVASALCRAARRGLKVRVLVDGFGAREFPRTLMPALVADGVQVLIYRLELPGLGLRRHRLRRLHRKITVVDGRLAFVGGINIIDDRNTPHQIPPRFDYAVCVEGPLLEPIQRSVRHVWEIVVWASFRHRFRLPPPAPACCPPAGNQTAAFVVRDNIRHRRDIEDAYLQAIGSAREEVILANAYFLPGRRFKEALREAATRGVRVTILLQGRVEYRLLHYASQALYGSLLEAGIRIVEYHRSFLHAKVAVVDRDWATVGSSNIDPFSLLLAREANVVVRDAAFTAELRNNLQQAMAEGGRELLPGRWRRIPWHSRWLRRLAYSVVRLLIGLAGYGARH